MPDLPAHVRTRILAELRIRQDWVPAYDIAADLDLDSRAVGNALGRWCRSGLAEWRVPERRRVTEYRYVAPQLPAPSSLDDHAS